MTNSLFQDFHQYYKTTKYEDGASWYWQELQDDAKHRKLSDIPDGYDVKTAIYIIQVLSESFFSFSDSRICTAVFSTEPPRTKPTK